MIFNLINLLTLSSSNMNGNVYDYSNPNIFSNVKFPMTYEKINSSYEYFDIYSHPITSRYGDVYWTMMPHVTLPNQIIDRFSNKIMAIVGYESDMVFPNGDRVPITWAYNHHYCSYLRGDGTDILQVKEQDESDTGQFNHGFRRLWKVNESYPMSSLFFSEANGGEFRQSFHGYPRNYAQLIKSPRYFDIQPMQIDTRNRDPRFINQSKFVAGILPKSSAAPSNATYSGLLECPCTTRIHKQINNDYDVSLNSSCGRIIDNFTTCLQQANNFGGNYTGNITILNNNSLPSGCFFRRNLSGYLDKVYLNKNQNTNKCGGNYGEYFADIVKDKNTNISIQLNMTNFEFILTMIGNSENWFGIAFDAHSMADLPYSIIVDGYGSVFEQKLGNHDQGKLLQTTLSVEENKVENGIRFVKIRRNNVGVNPEFYYTFNHENPNIPILLAQGNTPGFKYHKFRGTNNLYLSSIEGNTCICDIGKGGTINGLDFSKNCRPEPYGDLIQEHNPSCFLETYQGGLACCHHKNVLLDAEQIQPEHEMTYQLKFRFWFQEFYGQKQLERFYYQTEAFSGEYDVTQCPKGTPPEDCIHSITARFQGKDMISKDLIGNSKGFKLIYLAPHCHAATCIDMELYNSDTGDLICRVVGDMGNGTDKAYDEEGYIKLNPCLFGEDEGLLDPHFFRWDSNFSSIKRANNTYAHYGEMASWQMRGIIV